MARADPSVLPDLQMGCLHLGRHPVPCSSSARDCPYFALLMFIHAIATIAVIVGFVFTADFIHLAHVERIYLIDVLIALCIGLAPLLLGVIVLVD